MSSLQPRVPRPPDSTVTELTLVVLTSLHCSAANDRQYLARVDSIRARLSEYTGRRGVRLHVAGIALDLNADDGLRALKRLGQFDEILVGGGGIGAGSRVYLRGMADDLLATPQVLLLSRDFRPGSPPTIEREQVIARFVGTEEVARWLRLGAMVPE